MPLFDLHCDTLYECYHKKKGLWNNDGHVDIERGKALYQPWIQVFAAWMPDTWRGDLAFERCCEMLHFGRQQLLSRGEEACLITGRDELEKTVEAGGFGAILAVEGGSALAGRLETLAVLRNLGVKIITLTWNGSNELGNGVGTSDKSGLTPFGKQVVSQMEAHGIWPDVSHLNEAGFWDVLSLARGAVLATHSVSAAIAPHPRNLTDEQFKALCRTGGLIGLNVCAEQLGEQTFERWEAHLYHYCEQGGADHIALGMDLDGTAVREDWQGIAAAARFYEYLCRKNYEEGLLFRLFFGNCYDFFKQL